MGFQQNRPPQGRPPRPDNIPQGPRTKPSKPSNKAYNSFTPRSYMSPFPVDILEDANGYYYLAAIHDSSGQMAYEKVRLKKDHKGYYIDDGRLNKMYVRPRKVDSPGFAARKTRKRPNKPDQN